MESTESGIKPDARRQKIAEGTASTVRNDADSDVQVTDANTSSFEDPSSGLSSIASLCWKGEKHVRRDQVVDAFRSDCVDIDEEEAQEISSLLTEIGSVTRDCENPQKIAVSQCEKLGLRPGFVVDLNALKLWNRTAWSLGNPRDGEGLMNFLDMEDVKRIPPDTAIHKQNGYAKLLDDNILKTNVDNCDTTYKHKHNLREV